MPERHGHDPDKEYTAWVERALIDAIKEARTKLTPARLFAGTGFSTANINRRARDPRGRISLGLNPDGPDGPPDRPAPARAPGRLAHRAHRQLLDARDRPRPPEQADQRRCAGDRGRLRRAETRRADAVHQRRGRRPGPHLHGSERLRGGPHHRVQRAPGRQNPRRQQRHPSTRLRGPPPAGREDRRDSAPGWPGLGRRDRRLLEGGPGRGWRYPTSRSDF